MTIGKTTAAAAAAVFYATHNIIHETICENVRCAAISYYGGPLRERYTSSQRGVSALSY